MPAVARDPILVGAGGGCPQGGQFGHRLGDLGGEVGAGFGGLRVQEGDHAPGPGRPGGGPGLPAQDGQGGGAGLQAGGLAVPLGDGLRLGVEGAAIREACARSARAPRPSQVRGSAGASGMTGGADGVPQAARVRSAPREA
jgi:hypothetical protein